jgi:hypothetical protein
MVIVHRFATNLPDFRQKSTNIVGIYFLGATGQKNGGL